MGAAQQKVDVLGDLKTRRKSWEAQREERARLVGQYKQLERAFGKDGVPALLIEQALPQIEAKANEILDRLSSGNMSVRFITQAAYKDRRREDLRETLDIQISDGAGTRDYEMFSGGEAFRVNFAIRLALSEVLAQRAGARLQTLVIDEGFGSQDAQGRQRLVEAINLVRQDFAKILVITHIDELKDAFPQPHRGREDRTRQQPSGYLIHNLSRKTRLRWRMCATSALFFGNISSDQFTSITRSISGKNWRTVPSTQPCSVAGKSGHPRQAPPRRTFKTFSSRATISTLPPWNCSM